MYTAKRGYRPGDEPVPQYHLTKFLGRGQFGKVWQAKGPGGMQVALKIIDLGEREGLKEFAGLQRVKDIRHANLVEFVACWVKTEDGQVLDEVPADPVAAVSPRDSSVEIGGTMLFAEGASSPSRPVELIVAMSLGSKTLFERLQEINHRKEQKDWAGIPDEELLDYMEQAARGIDFLNQQKIIHGDIKPQNLLIVGNSVKVCDFGLAQAVDSLRKTQSGMGTVAYAAPELFEGKPHIQSDQYCLAISYVELRTGALPFDEPNPYKVIELHRHGKLDLQRLTGNERKTIKRATEIKPEKRWPSCFEMVSRLRDSRQDRSQRGGILASIFGGVRSPPTERFSSVEPPPMPDDLVQPGSGGKPGSKKGSGGAAPAKPDSGKKKSGPHSALEPRVVRTQHHRGDDTDAIAATIASGDIPEPPPVQDVRRGPSIVRRLLKVAVVLCLLVGLGYLAYKLIPPPNPPLIKTWTEHVRRGEFDKAVEIDIAQKTKLVTLEYEKWQADVRRVWSEPATNPILQRLSPNAPDAVDPREVRTLLEKAETHDGFRKLVEGVPEALWQPVRDAWKREFEEAVGRALDVDALDRLAKDLDNAPERDVPPIVREQLRDRLGQAYFVLLRDAIDKGNFQQAAEAASKVEGRLPLSHYEQLCNQIRKEWSGAATNPVLQQLTKGKIQVSEAIIRLNHADAEPGFVKLVGPVPEGVWQAVLKPWLSDFDARVAKGEFKEAADVLTSAKKQLVGERHLQLCGAAKKEWNEPSANGVLLQLKGGAITSRDGYLRLKNADAEESFVKLVGPVPAAVWQVVLEQWMKNFDVLLANDLQKAVDEWKAADKLEGAPSEVITPAQKTGLRSRLQEEWKRQTKFDDLVAKNDFRGARAEIEKPLAQDIFDETGLGEIRKEVQPKWTVYFDSLLKAPEPDLAKASQDLKDVGEFFDSAEQYKEKARKIGKVWSKGIGDLSGDGKWAEVKTLFDAGKGIVSQEDEDAARKAIRASFDEKLQRLVDQEKLKAAGDMVATARSIDLFLPDVIKEIEKTLEEKRIALREKWDKEFYALLDKDRKDKDWKGALEKLKTAPPELLLEAESKDRRSNLETAWRDIFNPLLKNGQSAGLDEAEGMLTSIGSIDLFPSTEIEAMRRSIRDGRGEIWVMAFAKAVKEAAAEKDWTAPTRMLGSPPSGLRDVVKYRAQVQASWDEVFDGLLAKKNLDAAQQMLAKVPSELFTPQERGTREAKLGRPQFEKLYTESLAAMEFAVAKKRLDTAVTQKLISAEEAQPRAGELRKLWFAWLCGNWEKSDPPGKFATEADAFPIAFPEPPEASAAKLLGARSRIHSALKTNVPEDVKAAAVKVLDELKSERLPDEQAYLRDALLVVKSDSRPELDKFRGEYQEGPRNLAAPWKLDPWEEEQLKRIGMTPRLGSPIEAVKKALAALNAPEAKPEAAGQLLGALEKHYPPGDPGRWANPEREEDLTLLTAAVPLALRKLAADVAEGGRPKYENQGKDLARAKTWLLAAKAKFPLPEIGSAAYAAATGRLALRVWESEKPDKPDLNESNEWNDLPKGEASDAAAGVRELMAKAWRAECMVSLGPNATSARSAVMMIRDDLAKKAKQPAYARYLWCRALKNAGSSWEDVEPDLFELAPALEGPDPILKAQDRAGTMAELIVEAAGQHRKRSGPWKLDKIPFNPFASSAEAEQYATLLRASRKLVDDSRQRDLRVSLALAEFHGSKPAMEQVWTVARELLALPNAGADPDIVPLLYAGASSFWQQPSPAKLPADDRQLAIGATARLLRELGKDDAGKFSQEGPKILYTSVLMPILDADFQTRAEARKQTEDESLSELAGAVAEFLDDYHDAQWPPWPERFRNVHDVIESQAASAIKLAAKDKAGSARLGDYYAILANARAYKPDFKADTVLEDVQTALKHQPSKPHRAFGAQTYALLMRAGERDKRDDILKDLTDAIAAGQQAVKSCPENHKAYPTYLLNLGVAHLRLGNYETEAEKRRQHLDAGRDAAIQAAKGVHGYGDEARLLLGNIYEDLASLIGESPSQNYQEALKRFSEVLQQNSLSAQALCSRARCIVKAIVRSRIDPRELALRDRDSTLKECITDLNRAVGYALNDSVRIEAYYYLGEVYDELGDKTRADENVGKAAELAIKLKTSTRAAYIYSWAMLALNQANRLLATRPATDDDFKKLLKAAADRAEILRKTPPGAFVIPTKQVALILGMAWEMSGELDRAISAYDEGIPDPSQADALDVPLLLARANCYLKRFERGKEVASAEAAIRDATRARELAPSAREKADAYYRLALLHSQLFQQGGTAAKDHRNKSIENVSEAVELTPGGANGVTYRTRGATFITNAIADWASEIDRTSPQAVAEFAKQAIERLAGAEKWLKDAISLEQDAERQKRIEVQLKVVQKNIEDLRAKLPPAPAPPANE